MMHGLGWGGADGICAAGGSGLFTDGWMVTGMMGFGFLLTVFVVGAVVWLLVSQKGRLAMGTPLSGPTGAARVPAGADHAEEIARARFARGEIDAEEYARLIAALRG